MKSHQKYAHSKERNEQCTYCEKFKQKWDLRLHLASIHDVDLSKETYGESYEKAVFKWGKCESRFSYKKNLNAHIRSIQSVLRAWNMTEFRYRKTLVDHVKSKHGTDQPKYECTKTFLQRKFLLKHQLFFSLIPCLMLPICM